MDRIAITFTATGQLLRWTNGTTDPKFDTSTETLITLTKPIVIPDGVDRKYVKLVNGVATEMTTAEKTVVDAKEKSLVVLGVTSHTIQDSDFGRCPALILDNASPITVSLNTGLSIPSCSCVILVTGLGQVVIEGTATLNSRNGKKSNGQYSRMVITYVGGIDTYVLSGDTTI